VAIVDPQSGLQRLAGVPVAASFEAVAGTIDAVVVTDLVTPAETAEAAIERFGMNRVLVPALLARRIRKPPEPSHDG